MPKKTHEKARKALPILLVLGGLLLMANNANAASLVVDVSGQTPFRTIQSALNAAQPGDVVRVRSGIYREYLTTKRGGTANAPIVLAGEPGATIIAPNAFDGETLIVAHPYWIITDLTIKKGVANLSIFNGQNVVVRNNVLSDGGATCLQVRHHSQSVVVENNTFSNCGARTGINKTTRGSEAVVIGSSFAFLTTNNSYDAPRLGKPIFNQQLDMTRDIVLRGNTINTRGPCMAVRPGSYNITIAENICGGNLNTVVGSFVLRGHDITLTKNVLLGATAGSGVLVGNMPDLPILVRRNGIPPSVTERQGRNIRIQGNSLTKTEKAAVTPDQLHALDLALICGNMIGKNGKEETLSPTKPCATPTSTDSATTPQP